jgi:HPt (histidine-containing phosphotransfer) domain-containing protein
MDSVTVLDRDVALARAGGDAVLLREIAALFLENYGDWLTELQGAVARGDAQGIARSAHGIKGSVANFGAVPAVDAALKLEQMGRQCDLAEVVKVLNSLELALAALHPELEAL